MSIFDQPLDTFPSEVIRRLWPERIPSVELRTRTLLNATAALHHAQASRAKPKAQLLAIAMYVGVFLLSLLTMLSFTTAWHQLISPWMHWAVIGVLALCSFAACLLAIIFAARWCRVMHLPRSLRWVPLVSFCGVLAIVAGVISQTTISLNAQDSRQDAQTSMPDNLTRSMDAVSSALTRTMTISESQAWLNTTLPRNVERAWFVTPEGLVALSSITTVNEISRSVMDYIAITQTSAVQNTGLSQQDLAALASLRGQDTLTRAMVVSNTPVALLVMVKQAMVNLSHAPQESQVYTRLISRADGTLAGIAAITWSPNPAVPLYHSAIIVLLGFVTFSLVWAMWVYLAEKDRYRNSRNLHVHPWRWALFTALLAPVGLFAYLFARSDEG